jgi:RNA polymerase sigma-70 factor, ECF subfamily
VNQLRPVPSGEPPPGRTGDADVLVELLARSARGDQAAFARLYDATAARVHGLVLRVVRNPALAEEVTQEVFLEVWRTASRFDRGRGSALSWLLTMAHRRAVDRVRSAEAASRNETTYHRQNPEVEHDQTAEAAEASLEARRVRDALAALTEVQRQALELAYFGGYTHTQVATMLDLPVGTAKTRIRDGLIRMRDAMGVGQ